MKTYFCIQGNNTFVGGWINSVKWAKRQILINPSPIKILVGRAGERYARVLVEITCEGIRYISNGRSLSIKGLIRESYKETV